MAVTKKETTFVAGEMAEWSIAAVLKTVELRGSGGSNPSLSATKRIFRQTIALERLSFFVPACYGNLLTMAGKHRFLNPSTAKLSLFRYALFYAIEG